MRTKEDLNQLFSDATDRSREDFAFMRTSLLLISGEHFNRGGKSQFFDRVRTSGQMSSSVKIRLTKNHIGRIIRRVVGLILESAPDVAIAPKNERELQDQKNAELNQAVWTDGKYKNDFDKMVMEWGDDFAGIGEVWTKMYFDPSAGAVTGYNQLVDKEGRPVFQQGIDENSGELVEEPIPDETSPVYEGQIKFETVYGFNMLVDPNCKDVTKSKWYCHRKMVNVKELKKQFPKYDDKIEDSADETFIIFDADKGYRQSGKGEVLIKEWFIRPSTEYPKGYYYIQLNDDTILDKGELPEGIFPIECERFDYIQTKCRGISATKALRPYQVEINRAASKIAEHQVTLGDDKLVLVNGSKLSSGASLPGVRSMTVTGQAPMVIEGRAGTQYVEYMLGQIKEMYEVADLDMDEADTANMEPHTLLFRSARQKRKFTRYIARFEGFLERVCKLYLTMAKYYLEDSAVIAAVGKSEAINIDEFKNTDDGALSFKVEPQTQDVETKLGRHLVIQNVLQYVGSQLDESSIGKLVSQMPYANIKDAFSDLTLDYESATNDLLLLDRGGEPSINPYDTHEYMIKRAVSRTRQADFQFLPVNIQQSYQGYIQAHSQFLEEQKQALQREQSGFIPDGGALVGIDMYVQDPKNPERTRRARIPQAAGEWLIQKLQEQGMAQVNLDQVPDEVRAQMAPEEGITQGLDLANLGMQAQGPNAEIIGPT